MGPMSPAKVIRRRLETAWQKTALLDSQEKHKKLFKKKTTPESSR